MAEATTLPMVTPKQMGGHLRSVRRRKGLSLSEVARGAGLSRRELVAYERGKVPIPESDLWVLAGSCGVDVAELVPPTTVHELDAGPSTIGETVAQLRRGQDDAGLTPYLATLQRLRELPAGKRIPVKDRELEAIADAFGRDPATIESRLQTVMDVSPLEAARLRTLILPPVGRRHRPRAIAAADVVAEEPAARYSAPVVPPPAPSTPLPTEHAAVDVFEELARLPEPLPLPDPDVPMPDMLATPPPPEGAVELVDGIFPPVSTGVGFDVSEPVLVDSAAAAGMSAIRSGADAPPIDVAMRQDDAWAWTETSTATPVHDDGTGPTTPAAPGVPEWEPPVDPTSPWEPTWEPPAWQPPSPDGASNGAPTAFWEGTDDWSPDGHDDATPADAWSAEPAAVDPWLSAGWPAGLEDDPEPVADTIADSITDTIVGPVTNAGAEHDVEQLPGADAGAFEDGYGPLDVTRTPLAPLTGEPAAGGPWDHEPDPEAVSTGFYVDWGTTTGDEDVSAEGDAPQWSQPSGWSEPPPPAWEMQSVFTPEDATAEVEVEVEDTFDVAASDAEPAFLSDSFGFGPLVDPDAIGPVDDFAPVELDAIEVDAIQIDAIQIDAIQIDDGDDEADDGADADADNELPPIMWRAEPVADLAPAAEDEWVPVPVDDEPSIAAPADERFVVAGSDWQLGNAVPLVEIQSRGSLVMRRADERWALADVTTTRNFVLEIDVDFRSGPGLGVLFRAGVDDTGRMSGYSFDIDPIYDGGGFLVRQWQDDRELWNPIARTAAGDPNTMYGAGTVRLEVHDEQLVAFVNGVEVLAVENLKQASADRGREAAAGDRVGVQAWSSSDLVIETLRVATP